jgi:multiple sugar transport system ATP-binding protein
MSRIRIDEVTKVYANGVKAADAVDLEIADGEFVVLVGPSGCGKSTLLRMIAGLEEVTDGAIFIDGVDVTDRPPQQRDIAMVFQDYALYPHMTVKENLAYGLKLKKMPKVEWTRRVHEVAKTLGLDDLLDRKPAKLSGGQRQRVAMGRAIVREPKAFLMDEPLSNLDAKLRVSMRAELAKLHERLGVTTVYVTHDQVEAMTLGQRVAILRDGVLQQVDRPQTLFRNPVNLFVAAFIGSPSMNLVPVKVNGQGVVDNAGNHWNVPHVPATSGQALTLGVRPEHLRLDDAGVEARVLVVESTGSETHLLVDAGGIKLTCVLRERVSVRPGDHVRLGADNAHLHLFHGDSGERLEPVH